MRRRAPGVVGLTKTNCVPTAGDDVTVVVLFDDVIVDVMTPAAMTSFHRVQYGTKVCRKL